MTTAGIERIDNLHGYELGEFEFSNFEDNYMHAKAKHNWKEVRISCQEQNISDERLEDALLEIVIRQKILAVGRAYSQDALLLKPVDNQEILKKINAYCGNNNAETVLTQELILHLGHLIRSEPELFENMITLRTWYFVQLLVSKIAKSESLNIAQSYEYLVNLAPHDIYERLRDILKSYSVEVNHMIDQENIQAVGLCSITSIEFTENQADCIRVDSWEKWRKESGMLARLSKEFYKGVWYLLQQCKGLVIGDKYNLENRISSDVTLESTQERNFDLKVEILLQNIEAPEYRQLNIELLESLIRLFRNNPEIKIDGELMLDVIIGHAVRVAWEKSNGEQNYQEFKTQAWQNMYELSPKDAHKFFIEAFMFLLKTQNSENQ